ncbi:hypothetical protein SUDANB1_05289 [Streptomyces sp. enrichment culture]|uniref:hypothetical protein n=1 Tax=Streptomyces sp. enrichment culture TaxID=1795815 RepID=UPI003F56ACB0
MSARSELYEYVDGAHLGGEYLDELLGRVEAEAVARATGRPVNETLVAARAQVGLLLETETGERFPQWRVIITDSESPTGFAPVCTAEGVDDEHHVIADYPGGPIRDEHGVYDCCPSLQVETYSPTLAAYVVELLNADTEAPGAVARDSEKDTRGESPLQGESTHLHPLPCEFPTVLPCRCPVRPSELPEASFVRARRRACIAAFFHGAHDGHAAVRAGAAQ